ncbi:hypothetical protein [Massilia cavernae]|uniref:hypothetical protein n=1 Tax=Massilia cavernae TaxID=2320864 RepID=UPI001603A6B3|nr:hypothetical protein [Massilia cavernae]
MTGVEGIVRRKLIDCSTLKFYEKTIIIVREFVRELHSGYVAFRQHDMEETTAVLIAGKNKIGIACTIVYILRKVVSCEIQRLPSRRNTASV